MSENRSGGIFLTHTKDQIWLYHHHKTLALTESTNDSCGPSAQLYIVIGFNAQYIDSFWDNFSSQLQANANSTNNM